MGQLRLDAWRGIEKIPTGASLLDLPAELRQRIYDEAGLVKGATVNLSRRIRHRDDATAQYPSDCRLSCCNPPARYLPGQAGFPVTYRLLQTCHAVYNDIIPVVYSSNTFMISYPDLESLEPLWSLPPSSLSCLTRLVIRLNVSCCDSLGGCCTDQNPLGGHLRPLERVSCFDQRILDEWERTATRLARYTPADQLRLKFTCDLNDRWTADQLTAAFRQLPRLKSCSIKLNCEPNPKLRQLARDTVIRSTSTTRRSIAPYITDPDAQKTISHIYQILPRPR